MIQALIRVWAPPALVALLSLVFPPFDTRTVALAAAASMGWMLWGVVVPGRTTGLLSLVELLILLATIVTWVGCAWTVVS